jgi:hypothetical protein
MPSVEEKVIVPCSQEATLSGPCSDPDGSSRHSDTLFLYYPVQCFPLLCAFVSQMFTCHKYLAKNKLCEGVSKSFRTESITKYTLTFGIACWETTERVVAAKLTRLTHKIAIQLHLVAESYSICSSLSRRPVRKLLVTPSSDAWN